MPRACVKTKWGPNFPGGPGAKTLHPQCRGPIPSGGTRFHLRKLRSKISSATTKSWCSQINKDEKSYFLKMQAPEFCV